MPVSRKVQHTAKLYCSKKYRHGGGLRGRSARIMVLFPGQGGARMHNELRVMCQVCFRVRLTLNKAERRIPICRPC